MGIESRPFLIIMSDKKVKYPLKVVSTFTCKELILTSENTSGIRKMKDTGAKIMVVPDL